MKNDIKNFKEACAFFDGIPQFSGEGTGFSCGIDRARLFLDYAGHPEKNLKIIHVAGSNGKGSVCAMLDAALRFSGLKTGLFTSPHLTDIRERIRLSGSLIPEAEFVRTLNEVLRTEERIRRDHPDFRAAYFEYLFVMSLLYFKANVTDFVILETGLGGRLDAVNACEAPILCVITPVSLEHTVILGESIDKIAAEKAGIIKPGVPVVVTGEDAAALEMFKAKALAAGSPIEVFGSSNIYINAITDEIIDFSLHNRYYRNVTVSLPIPAPYAAFNAGLALTALAVLAENKELDEGRLSNVEDAFKAFRWPGRMELIAVGVYVDGAHNTAGIAAFTESAAAFAGGKQNVLLFAVSDDKDKSGMIKLLVESDLFSDVIVTAFSGARSAAAEEIAAGFEACGFDGVAIAANVSEGLEKALAVKHDYVFCTGSLYLAAEISGIYKGLKLPN